MQKVLMTSWEKQRKTITLSKGTMRRLGCPKLRAPAWAFHALGAVFCDRSHKCTRSLVSMLDAAIVRVQVASQELSAKWKGTEVALKDPLYHT